MNIYGYGNFSIAESSLSNLSDSFEIRNEDYSFKVQEILTKFIRPPVLIFGICGNILNLIILVRHRSPRTRSAIAFIITMSLMDLVLLCVQLIYIIFGWIKSVSLLLATIATYYRCFIRYLLFIKFSFIQFFSF